MLKIFIMTDVCVELFYIKCRQSECHIHFSAQNADARLEVYVIDLYQLGFRDPTWFCCRMRPPAHVPKFGLYSVRFTYSQKDTVRRRRERQLWLDFAVENIGTIRYFNANISKSTQIDKAKERKIP